METSEAMANAAPSQRSQLASRRDGANKVGVQQSSLFRLGSLRRQGALYSGPYFDLFIIVVVIPSLVLTGAVCLLIYLGVRALRRGRKAFAALMLIAALSPFILFASSIVQSILADRERAKPLAGLAKTGPVTSYPDVLVVRGIFSNSEAAQLMLGAGLREVDVIYTMPWDVPGTHAIAPIAGCREALEAWAAERGADDTLQGGATWTAA